MEVSDAWSSKIKNFNKFLTNESCEYPSLNVKKAVGAIVWK